ncbi:hypothetical protein DSO57_1039515 [Entomophthora muscae]|uniref:Uncharacterized protein n=1 Tax=Entomophthora muscae TaxID=34485 RepID=A0ACC2S091_9FUNG|nr:hypothetical protein DSO57_1039515 [Entomophthora muscae]
MLVPLVKFVAFTLAPALLMIWSTSPDLWGRIANSFLHVGSNPDQLLNMFEDIPAHTQGIYTTSENVVRSLTCNDLDLPTAKTVPAAPLSLGHPTLLPSENPHVLVSEEGLATPELTPKRASWLLNGMILMGLDSYFTWVSVASSLWTPLQAAMPVLYWMASLLILPPGWEPNLVSLAPLSHSSLCIVRYVGRQFWKLGCYRGLITWFAMLILNFQSQHLAD